MYKPFAPKCPWLAKIKPCDSQVGYKIVQIIWSYLIILCQFPLFR